MERFTLKIMDKPRSTLRNVCRLCGMDNPHKVSILRDEDFFCEDDVPLSVKIRVCCGIEVSKKDRMPQKICTLCSDKISDFYEFREMCTATNVQTRDLLGLPREEMKLLKTQLPAPKAKPVMNNTERRDAPSKTILQPPIITESKTMRDVRDKKVQPKVVKKVVKKKAPGKVIKQSRPRGRPTKKVLRSSAKLVIPKEEPKDPPPKPAIVDMKPLMKPAVVKLTNILPIPKVSPAPKSKKTVAIAPAIPVTKRPSEEVEKPAPKKKKVEKPPKPPVMIKCTICSESIAKDIQAVHMMQLHAPKTFEFGCSPCGVPFETAKDYKEHQNWHRDACVPFRCFKCHRHFEKLAGYAVHAQKYCTENHIFTNTVPDTNCTMCGKEFVTFNLYNWHDCFIKANTNCPKCDRFIQRKDRLFRHIFVCKGKGADVTPDVSDADSIRGDTPVPKVKPLKIKIHKKFATVTSGARSETVIKSEPDSTLEIEESQVNSEGASLYTSFEDIQPPKKVKKKKTFMNPFARLAMRVKQEPKDPADVTTVPKPPAPKPPVRVKQEPVDSGYDKMVRMAAKNIKKERIDPPEKPPQDPVPEDPLPEDTEDEPIDEPIHEEDEPPPEDERDEAEESEEEHDEPPPLPRGVRIKQEKPDVIVKPEPIDTAYDKHLPQKPKAPKPPKKRVFKIPLALIQKLQQEKQKQANNHENDKNGEVPQDENVNNGEKDNENANEKANEKTNETQNAPGDDAPPIPVITGVRSIEKSDFTSPFVPVRIKRERISPTRTLQRKDSTTPGENGVNAEQVAEEQAASTSGSNVPATTDENLPDTASISRNEQNGV